MSDVPVSCVVTVETKQGRRVKAHCSEWLAGGGVVIGTGPWDSRAAVRGDGVCAMRACVYISVYVGEEQRGVRKWSLAESELGSQHWLDRVLG